VDRPVTLVRRVLAITGVAVALALVAVGCTDDEQAVPTTVPPPAPVAPVPMPGGTLRVASGVLPTDWSPAAQVWDTSAQQVARGLYDRLAAYDVDNVAQPELAEAITSDPTSTRWTIRLRRGVFFQDGTTLHADDVVANLEAQRRSPVGLRLLAPVADVTATDSRTVVVTTNAPWSTFAEVLASQVGTIASPATLAAGGSTPPVGTGPFRWAGVDPPDDSPASGPRTQGALRLERSPLYWRGGLPLLDGVTFPVVAEPSLRVSAVLAGAADMVTADRPAQLARLDRAAAAGEVRLVEDRNAEAPKVVVALNTARAPFDAITARRAVALGTDREELRERALRGQGTAARGIISDPSPWFTDLPEPVPDTTRAQGEVDAYVEEFGVPIAAELLVPRDPFLLDVARLWRAQQAAIGVEITIRPVTEDELRDLTRLGQYQAAMFVGFTSPHPDLYEPVLGGLPGEQPAVNVNITRYVNPVVTEAFADARATTDPAVQVEAYRIVQEQLFLDLPWVFLLQLRQVVAVAPQVRDAAEWMMASGERGLGQEGATVSLAQVWLGEAEDAGSEGSVGAGAAASDPPA
jgi:ABC-type transport system substrate-binding protein